MTAKPTGVWLLDGDLVYRLADTPHGVSNCDEIRVTQVGGSRGVVARQERAEAIRVALQMTGSVPTPRIDRFTLAGDPGAECVRNGHGYWELHRDGELVCELSPRTRQFVESALAARSNP